MALDERAVDFFGLGGQGGRVTSLGAGVRGNRDACSYRLGIERRLQPLDFIVVDRDQRGRVGVGDEIFLVA